MQNYLASLLSLSDPFLWIGVKPRFAPLITYHLKLICMQNYKDLKVWEKAHKLTVSIYKMTMTFPKDETYALVSQVRRAASSIPANIAEGCGRNTNADFANFLNIAMGSSNELDYFLLLAKDLVYISEEIYTKIEKLIGEIKAMLIALISKVRTK